MTVSDNYSFEEHPFCVTICIFDFNIQQNKQGATNINVNEGKTDDIHDGYHCVYLPVPTFLHLLSFCLHLLILFPPPSNLFYHSLSEMST